MDHNNITNTKDGQEDTSCLPANEHTALFQMANLRPTGATNEVIAHHKQSADEN